MGRARPCPICRLLSPPAHSITPCAVGGDQVVNEPGHQAAGLPFTTRVADYVHTVSPGSLVTTGLDVSLQNIVERLEAVAPHVDGEAARLLAVVCFSLAVAHAVALCLQCLRSIATTTAGRPDCR